MQTLTKASGVYRDLGRHFFMTRVWTVYTWTTKPGRDREFVEAWRRFASWIIKQTSSKGSTRLFRDRSELTHFFSVDSWDNEMTDPRFRDEFNDRLGGLRRFLTNFASWSLALEAKERRSESDS
jgi:hypothetical protein